MSRQSNYPILKLSLLAVLVFQFTVFAQVETEAVKKFNARVKAYMELQKRVSSNVPPLTTTETPATIAIRTKALANGIQLARANAKAGDIFSPQVARGFRQIIRGELHGKAGAPSRETVKIGNPTEEEGAAGKIVLAANVSYPDKAPRSSVPPNLLLNLPQLPKGLEYRFLGRHLILLDSMSNLIVDYLLDVVPKG